MGSVTVWLSVHCRSMREKETVVLPTNYDPYYFFKMFFSLFFFCLFVNNPMKSRNYTLDHYVAKSNNIFQKKKNHYEKF